MRSGCKWNVVVEYCMRKRYGIENPKTSVRRMEQLIAKSMILWNIVNKETKSWLKINQVATSYLSSQPTDSQQSSSRKIR